MYLVKYPPIPTEHYTVNTVTALVEIEEKGMGDKYRWINEIMDSP